MRRAILLGLLALGACEAPTIPGRDASDVYDFTLLTQPPLVLRWPAGARIRVWVEPSTVASRTALLESALETGAAAWNDRAVFAEYRITRATDLGNADVVLMWSDVLPPVETDSCRPVLSQAVTTFCVTDLSAAAPRLRPFPLIKGGTSSVRMLVTVLATQASQPEIVSRLVAHELGHVLGIGRHSPDPDDLMWRADQVRATPSPRDAATVQVLYHVRPDILP